MSFETLRLAAGVACVAAMAVVVGPGAVAQTAQATLRFFPDDPLQRDNDAAVDVSSIQEREL